MSRRTDNRPVLTLERNDSRLRLDSVSVRNLDPEVVASLAAHPQAAHLQRSMLRLRVVGTGAPGEEADLPDVLGEHQILERGIRFIPRFPFESGVRYRASFDPRPLGHPKLSEALTLQFSLARQISAVPTEVDHVFPSDDVLPENLLRLYLCFSNSMQRGQAEEQIRLLGPDGRPRHDVLYRPPVELWDASMRHLTILLDPGRLKRWVGPNRELGPPLKAGEEYTLVVGSGMVDSSGLRLGESFYKTFKVTEAIRDPIAVEHWKILPPASRSLRPLALIFPRPLDWALLWRQITVASDEGQEIPGQVAIDLGERRWSFTPISPWAPGAYNVCIARDLEDVCGNTVTHAFDGPLRLDGELPPNRANHSIPFRVA